MASFFKTFLKGILYIVLLPFIALLLAIYFIYCLLVFLYMSIRCIIVFFLGGSPLGDLPEDIKAKEIIASQLANPAPIQQTYQQFPSYEQHQQIYNQNSFVNENDISNNEQSNLNDDFENYDKNEGESL